jgi:hypothetical protein
MMPSYDEIKNELSEIATILAKLPEQVRSQAYELLISEFLGRPTDTLDASRRGNAGGAEVNVLGQQRKTLLSIKRTHLRR